MKVSIAEIKDEPIKIKQATKQGFIELITFPGVVDLSYPTSKVRRGRVQEGGAISPTLTTTGGLYVFEEYKSI